MTSRDESSRCPQYISAIKQIWPTSVKLTSPPEVTYDYGVPVLLPTRVHAARAQAAPAPRRSDSAA